MKKYTFNYSGKKDGKEIRVVVGFGNDSIDREPEWIIEDVLYCNTKSPTRKFVSKKEKLSKSFRSMGLSYFESHSLIKQGLFEFAGKENIEAAFNAAWQSIMPNLAEILK